VAQQFPADGSAPKKVATASLQAVLEPQLRQRQSLRPEPSHSKDDARTTDHLYRPFGLFRTSSLPGGAHRGNETQLLTSLPLQLYLALYLQLLPFVPEVVQTEIVPVVRQWPSSMPGGEGVLAELAD